MSSKNNTYVIGCKLPNGLVIRGAGQQVKLNGANSSALINGYGTTENVPADVWDAFAKDHKDSKLLANGVVFAVGDLKSAQDAAKEGKDQKTGLEQLKPEEQATKPDSEE